MALHHEKLFLNVMCHSGDVSKQDDGGAARIGPSFPFRVKLRKTQHERMSSAFSRERTFGTPNHYADQGRYAVSATGTGASRSLAQSEKRYYLHQAQQELGEKIKKIPAWEVA
jgi:hypothetical protein